MKNNKWSEQILINDTDGTRTLLVCTDGQELFNSAFRNGKYEGQNHLVIPFDFILVPSTSCPHGKFYELEYMVEEYGMVYRALMQLVDPVADIRLAVATLRHYTLLPEGFRTLKAYLRDDIDCVNIGSCEANDNGEPTFYSAVYRVGNDTDSIFHRSQDPMSACMCRYSDTLVEVWTEQHYADDQPPIFVAGSSNVDDPAFEAQRQEDFNEVDEHLNEAASILGDYNRNYLFVTALSPDTINSNSCAIYGHLSPEFRKWLAELLLNMGERNKL